MSIDLTVIILTRNEERHIARAIASLGGLARAIVVIDSGSTDDTCAIAAAAGATVLSHPFTTHARQFNWALDHAEITTGWIMRLDADEVLEPPLVGELPTLLTALPDTVTGVEIDRKHIFMGRWIRHGGRFPVRLLRIWRTGRARVEDRWMDEHVVLDSGETVRARGCFADHNLQDLTFFTHKHNDYATREAIDVLMRRHGLIASPFPVASSLSRQASVKRWIKVNVYNRMPFWLSAPIYFSFRFIIQGGFRDGREGLIYHVLQGFWYRFLVGAKILEFDRAMHGAQSPLDRVDILSAVSGHMIDHPQRVSGSAAGLPR